MSGMPGPFYYTPFGWRGGPAFRVLFAEARGSSVIIAMEIPALSLQNQERRGRGTLGKS